MSECGEQIGDYVPELASNNVAMRTGFFSESPSGQSAGDAEFEKIEKRVA
jgi:hypothetical protein